MGITFIVCEWDERDGTSGELDFPTFTAAHNYLLDRGWEKVDSEYGHELFGAYYTYTEEGDLPCSEDCHADITMEIS